MDKIFIAGLISIIFASVLSFGSVNWLLFFNAIAFALLLVVFYRFTAFIRQTKIAMLLKDETIPSLLCSGNGDIIAYNTSAIDLFGSEGNVIDNLKEKLSSEYPENNGNIKSIEDELKLKGSLVTEISLKPEGTSFLRVKIRYVPELKAFILQAEDISDSYFWQKSLLKQNETALSLLDNMGVGLYSCDDKGRIIMANPTFCSLFDINPKDINSCFLQDLTNENIKEYEGLSDVVFGKKEENQNTFLLCQTKTENKCYGAVVPGASKITDKDKELAETRNHISWLFGETPLGIALLDMKEEVYEVNPPLLKMLNLEQEDLIRKKITDIIRDDGVDTLLSKMRKVMSGELNAAKCEIKIAAPENKADVVKIFEIFIRPTRNISSANKNELTGLILHFFDATEWRNLEIQFEQAQKMQAMGQMAGGIAHEFNNTLTAILGFCEFLLERHPAGDPSFVDIRRIVDNANHSANLVRQLLAFSRKQSLIPRITDTFESVADIMDMLRQLVGRSIKIKEDYGRNLGYIRVDQGQLGQVFANLALNSKYAMHDKGTITLKVEKFDVTEPWQMGAETVSSGAFVKFEFSDDGEGIKAVNLKRIFEPFFSTKSDSGAGTGLGLATVYGIIKQTDGYIKVESVEGQGTTFTILLPRYEKPKDYTPLPANAKAASPMPQLVTITASAPVSENVEVEQSKTQQKVKILLAEDEAGVRMFAARALTKKGYGVTVCENGVAALEKIQKGETFDLLLTDMSMPLMTGTELAAAAKKILPDMKIIVMSGFSEDIAKGALADDTEINFLAKPFDLKQITSKVQEVIEGNDTGENEV